MTSVRAARFEGEGRVTLRAREIAVPGPGEARVRVAACCLCGSDLRPWRAGWPVTPGHEIAGIVDQPGHAMNGKRVAIYIPVFCGACEECREGHTNTCERMTDLVGWQRDGGYADALVVPDQCLLPLPDDVPIDLAPLLLDTIGTAAHGVRLARHIVDGGPALVVGAGPVGAGAVRVLKRLGFGPVDVVEPVERRRAFAASLGATPVAEPTKRYPIVIEASGKDAGRQMALDRVAPRGAVVQLGESERWSIEETKPIRRKDFHLIRSFYFPKAEFEANVQILRADMDLYARFVDERVGLQGLPDLFTRFAAGERLKPAFVAPEHG